MVREDFIKILYLFWLNNIPVEVVTNGILLDKNNIQFFEQSHILGNARKDSFLDVWRDTKSQKIRKFAYNLTEEIYCNKCSFSMYCAVNYWVAKNYLKFDNFFLP